MENSAAPIVQPINPPPWKIAFLILIIIILSVGLTTVFFLKIYSKPSPSPTPIATIAPTPAPSCDVADNAFCSFISDIKSAISANNYSGFLTYQNLESTTCDPDGMFISICEGVAKGVVKQGYSIGYNQSEGTMLSKDDYLSTVAGYVKSNGPFSYHESIVQGNKGVAVFLNSNKDHIMVFPAKRSGTSWKMDYLLVGGAFGDNSFVNLNNSLLDFVQ